MQDKDTEAINNQRKRRKRIGRIRNGIIMTIAGWIILCDDTDHCFICAGNKDSA